MTLFLTKNLYFTTKNSSLRPFSQFSYFASNSNLWEPSTSSPKFMPRPETIPCRHQRDHSMQKPERPFRAETFPSRDHSKPRSFYAVTEEQIYSFVPISLVHSFIHSFIHSIIHSFIHHLFD